MTRSITFFFAFYLRFIIWSLFDGCPSRDQEKPPRAPSTDTCVCALHTAPFFLPIDIRHIQLPCRIFKPRAAQALWSQRYATEILHCHAVPAEYTTQCHAISYWIRQARHTHSVEKKEQTKYQYLSRTGQIKRTAGLPKYILVYTIMRFVRVWSATYQAFLGLQSRIRDKLLKFQVICPQLSPERDCSPKKG